jgi:hypothetical protein
MLARSLRILGEIGSSFDASLSTNLNRAASRLAQSACARSVIMVASLAFSTREAGRTFRAADFLSGQEVA